MPYVDGSVIIDVKLDQQEFNNKLKGLSKTATTALVAVGTAIAGLSIAVLKVGKEFESAFAGVRKTVDATEEEFAQFKKEILDLSTVIPLAAKEIAGIVEAAGQLGIKNENLMEFTRTMADLGVATDMSATEAATALARFANVTGMVQEDFDRLGSSIVALGNNLATTESEIVDMAMNIGAAASEMGILPPEIMAIAASFSSIGIEAAAGGTAVSTMLYDMRIAVAKGGQDLDQFAKVANMTASEFKHAFETDAAGALMSFVQGLATAEERGMDAVLMLQEMGITEVRMTKALMGAKNAVDLFGNAIDISNQAWDENIALTNEAAQRYQTTESKMQLLANAIAKVGIEMFEKFEEPFKGALDAGIKAVGELSESLSSGKLGTSVDKLAKAVSGFAKSAIEFGTKALPIVIDGLAWVLDNHKLIIGAMMAMAASMATIKIANTFKEAQPAIIKFVQSIAAANGMITKASVSAAALKFALSPAGIGLMIGAFAALTIGVKAFVDSQDTATKRARDLNKELAKQRQATEDLIATSRETLNASLAEIQMNERYYDILMNNIDAEGKIIGSKEDAMYAIEMLNQTLGTSIELRDGETVIMNEQIDKIQQLISAKRAEAFINANQELYNQYLEEGNGLLATMAELNTNINNREDAIQQLEKINGLYLQGLMTEKERAEQAAEIMKEFEGMNEADLGLIHMDEIKALEEAKNKYVALQDVMSQVETAQRAIITGDYTDFNNMVNGINDLQAFDASNLENIDTAIQELADQVTSLQQEKEAYLQLIADQGLEIDENKIKALDEAIKFAEEQLAAAQQERQTLYGDENATAYSDSFIGVLGTNLVPRMAEAGQDGAEALIDEADSKINAWQLPTKTVDIIANYIGFDTPPSRNIGTSGSGSPYASPFMQMFTAPMGSEETTSMSMMAAQTMSNLNNAVYASSVLPRTLTAQVNKDVSSPIEIEQNNYFNTPVESPAETARRVRMTTEDVVKKIG